MRGRPGGAVHDYPQGLAFPAGYELLSCRRGRVLGQARGELRIVGLNRADAYHDGIVLITPAVDQGAGSLAGDPAGITGASCDLAIEAAGQLERDKGQTRLFVLQIRLVKLIHRCVIMRTEDLDTSGTQGLCPTSGATRVRVLHGIENPAYASGDDRLSARRRTAVMAARLQGAVQISSGSGLTSSAQGQRLSMRLARTWVIALTDYLASRVDYDGADGRIRGSAA